MVEPKTMGNLLQRPALGEQALHLPPQPGVPGELRHLRAPSLPGRPLFRPSRPVSFYRAVGGDLARDRRGRPAQTPGDRPVRIPRLQAARDLLPLGDGKVQR